MDGNIYNYAAGNMWNGYNEGFQPPGLELQNYMSANREHFPREQNKTAWVPPAPHYVFFNYPEQSAHHHHHHHHQHHQHHHENSRNQWHFPAWPKMKTRADSVFQDSPKRYVEKEFLKDDGLGMSVIQQAPLNVNMMQPGGFCAPDTSNQTINGVHGIEQSDIHETVNATIPVMASSGVNHLATKPESSQRSASRKTSSSKKRREKPKKDDKQVKKRTRDEENWARNIRKKARSRGESYVSVQGKTVPARSVKMVDCSKCKFNCPTRVSEEERHMLFKEYWGLESFKDKVDYIAKCVNEFAPLRPVTGRRAYSRRYMLKINGREERVCKEFFVSTFDISESTIVTYMGKKRKAPEAITDLRGKQTPSNKTPETTVRLIREHILSRTGLQGEIVKSSEENVKNVKKLYHHYQSECELEAVKPASISVYRKVYSGMHKDKNKAPIEIPPDSVLMQSKKKRLESVESESSAAADSLKEEEDNVLETSQSSELSTASNSLPLVAEVTNTTSSVTLPDAAVPHDLGLVSYPYQSEGQHLPSNTLSTQKMYSLNIPHMGQQHQQHHHHDHSHHIWQQQQIHSHQQPFDRTLFSASYQMDPLSGGHKKGHINSSLPGVWDPSKINGSSVATDHNQADYCSASYSNQNHLIPPPSSALSSSSFSYKVTSKSSSSNTASLPTEATSNMDTQTKQGEAAAVKRTKENKAQKSKEIKSKQEAKKRTRNEDSWGRNVRKRLRFKGEAYTSVRGKLVEAKRVREVDCSKCKFKCTSRINQEQRQALNQYYWNLDTYKRKIEFLTKYVATYTPKRKMTGRRVFSRKYTFDVDGKEERVCKDFFKATLHISESTIATALEKSRQGPDAVVDLRGKHTPVNKTAEDTLQTIRELIIYLTGMRPNRSNNISLLKSEYRDANRLYQIYKYDSEKKGKKAASLGIFRNILVREFGIKSLKPKKVEISNSLFVKNNTQQTTQKTVPSSAEAWPVSLTQPCSSKNKTSGLTKFVPKTIFAEDSQLGEFNIPNI